MTAPERFVAYLQETGYHPRSNAHGRYLCACVLHDLLASCPRIARDAADGRLVYDEQRKIIVATSEWNIDLVLGPPAAEATPPADGIRRSPPATIRIAVEAKTIMTEHGKARRNRQRDLDSFHQFIHRYDPDTIAAALTVVNVAERFKSPLRADVSVHRNVKTLVQTTLDLLRALPTRSATSEVSGMEANGAILVAHDNLDPDASRLVSTPPAPQIGDPIHYATFLRRICDRYGQRWP